MFFHPTLEGAVYDGIDSITQDFMEDNVSSIILFSSTWLVLIDIFLDQWKSFDLKGEQ